MPSWRDNLTDLYRLLTLPVRASRSMQMQQRSQIPVFVLFYHRVSDADLTPWTMKCRDFEAQLDWLGNHFRFVSLAEAQQLIASGKNSEPVVSITFDDGYAENSEFAIPLMLERRIPLTYFVTVDHAVHQRPFLHDVKLGKNLPVNSIESLRQMAMAGIEIGSHTRSHCDVGSIQDPDRLYDEIIESTRELEQAIGQRVERFAFPFGKSQNLSQAAFELLQTHGFQAACTTMHGFNRLGDSHFEINRFHGDPSLARIKNWLSFDPRISAGAKYFKTKRGVSNDASHSELPTTVGQDTQLLDCQHHRDPNWSGVVGQPSDLNSVAKPMS